MHEHEHEHGEHRFGAAAQAAEWDARYSERDGAMWSGRPNGRLLAEVTLPANASGAPMTYLAGGKQYVAFPVGGSNVPEELIALALP